MVFFNKSQSLTQQDINSIRRVFGSNKTSFESIETLYDLSGRLSEVNSKEFLKYIKGKSPQERQFLIRLAGEKGVIIKGEDKNILSELINIQKNSEKFLENPQTFIERYPVTGNSLDKEFMKNSLKTGDRNSVTPGVEINTIRKKRGAAQSTILICPPTSPIPSIESQEKFQNNPVTWFGENSLSTFLVNSHGSSNLINGNVYPFSLTKVGIDRYILSPNTQDANAIKGYWLSTGQKITIDPHHGPRFIFTGELQGCSIHIKHDKTTNKMEVFHRNREHLKHIYFDATGKPIDSHGKPISELAGVEQLLDKNGNHIEAIPSGSLSLNDGVLGKDGRPITTINGINIEELLNSNLDRGTDELTQFLNYDLKGGTTISWEEYTVGLPRGYDAVSAANPGTPRINTTPLLYRQDNGEWVFISQQIKYSRWGGTPSVGGRQQIFNFELTGKTFIKKIEGIPLPPQVRKRRSAQAHCVITLKGSKKSNIDNVRLSDLSVDKIKKIDGDMLPDYIRKFPEHEHQLLEIVSQATKAGVPVITSESSRRAMEKEKVQKSGSETGLTHRNTGSDAREVQVNARSREKSIPSKTKRGFAVSFAADFAAGVALDAVKEIPMVGCQIKNAKTYCNCY